MTWTVSRLCTPALVLYCSCEESRCIEVSSNISAGISPIIESSCVIGDILVRDVEAGGLAGLKGVRTIHGSLALESSDAVVDMTPMSSLEVVEGNFAISGLSVAITLPDAWMLAEVGGVFAILDNQGWDGAANFDELRLVNDAAAVSRNPALTSLAFSPDVRISDLTIDENDRLEALLISTTGSSRFSFLNNASLRSVEISGAECNACSFTISNNLNIADISISWPDLSSAFLSIVANPRLSGFEVDGGRNLGSLTLAENAALADLSGLAEIERIRTLSLVRNAALSTLTGLVDLAVVHDLYLFWNESLLPVEIDAFISRVEVEDISKIAVNGPGAAPLEPCPYEADGQCDADSAWFGPGTGICLMDEADCPVAMPD